MTARRAGQIEHCDVAVIGGGAAGLAAALLLGRSRRSVVVIDAGSPRNAPAAHMHGYLGHDGLDPAELLRIGRDEVRHYGVQVLEGCRGEVAHLESGGFRVDVSDGSAVLARRVLLAAGVVDVLPDIDGLAEQWGRGVLHCPYCHGWEVRDKRIVVIATGPRAAHQAGLFRQLSERVTVVLHESTVLADDAGGLAARGVAIVEGPVSEILSSDDQVTGVRLQNDVLLAADAVVVSTHTAARTRSIAALGLGTASDAMGMDVVATDAAGETAVAGLYAAGNVADSRFQVLHAAAAGATVAAAINASLVAEDTVAAVNGYSSFV